MLILPIRSHCEIYPLPTIYTYVGRLGGGGGGGGELMINSLSSL